MSVEAWPPCPVMFGGRRAADLRFGSGRYVAVGIPSLHSKARLNRSAGVRCPEPIAVMGDRDSNLWPPRCERDALASWANRTQSSSIGLASQGSPAVHVRMSAEARPPCPVMFGGRRAADLRFGSGWYVAAGIPSSHSKAELNRSAGVRSPEPIAVMGGRDSNRWLPRCQRDALTD